MSVPLTKSVRFREIDWVKIRNFVNYRKPYVFKFPPRLGPFCQINYLFELFSGYPSYPNQKWYIWASFQTSRKRFRKLQEAIWLTVINVIFKVPPHFDLFCQVNCLYKLSSLYPKDQTQKWYVWTSFQTSKKRFCKLQEAIWLTVINVIFKFPPSLGSFCQITYLFELFLSYSSYPMQEWYIWAGFQITRNKFRKFFKFSQ